MCAREMEGLKVHLITYNVGTLAPDPNSSLAPLLPQSTPDLVFVGFQEVNSAPSSVLLDTLVEGEDPWTRKTKKTLAKRGFIKIKTIRLMGVVLSFFCLEKHVPYIRGMETQYTRLGLNGYWGNKGTVSVRFNIYGVSVCVLNSHLAAHDHFNQARIDSYNMVLGSHTFKDPSTELIMYNDYVLWMGDLNFRLEEDTFNFQEIELAVAQEHRTSWPNCWRWTNCPPCASPGPRSASCLRPFPPFPPPSNTRLALMCST